MKGGIKMEIVHDCLEVMHEDNMCSVLCGTNSCECGNADIGD